MTTYTHPDNITALPYYQQVLRGMAYIDQEHLNKQWYDDVPLDALDMGSPDLDVLRLTLGARYEGLEFSQAWGFYAPGDHDTLTDTWRVLLRLRSQLPPLPDGHVFLGVGKADNSEYFQGIRHCFGWRDGTRWEEGWSGEGSTALNYNYVAYCVDRANPAAQTLLDALPPEDKEKTVTQQNGDEKYRKELRIYDNQNVSAYGYTFSAADVDALDHYIQQTGEMNDACFDLEIAAVNIGCQRFEAEELRGLIRAYMDMKREEREQIFVTCGDRVARMCPDGHRSEYMVAQIGHDDYMLVSTSRGNRWNSVVVRNPEDWYKIPLRSFLTDSDTLSDWSKT